MERNFKVLMFNNIYVDFNLLSKGIYETDKPILYNRITTIDDLVNRSKMLKDKNGKCFISDDFFTNLKQCELINIRIKFDN